MTAPLECFQGPLDGEQVSDGVPEPFFVTTYGAGWRPAVLPYDWVCGFTVHHYSRCLEPHLHYLGIVPAPDRRTWTGPHQGA